MRYRVQLYCGGTFIIYNVELNELRIIIRLRNSEVSLGGISVCNVIRNLIEHGKYCQYCSYTNDVIDMLP